MASITKHGAGWRAQVYRNGRRDSKVLPTKREAQDWAARREYEITHAKQIASRLTFGEVMHRYAAEVSPSKRGARWEVIRLARMSRDPLAKTAMGDLSAKIFADWRNQRQREVSAATVVREMNLLSAVLTQAKREWGLIEANPLEDVRRPKQPPARDRLPTQGEFERLAASAGGDLSSPSARAFQAFLFGCETAMRAGEICGLTWDRVDLSRRIARLTMTKNGYAREVPLSSEAVAILQCLPRSDPVFGLTAQRLDALFRSLKARAMVEGLHFHDSRAYATTRLAAKVDVLTLARITGHRDLSMLMRYYRETAEDIAKKLG